MIITLQQRMMENCIFSACNDSYTKRDFTQQEMAFIKEHEEFREQLLVWLNLRISDGCWTTQTLYFLRSLENDECLDQDVDDELIYEEIVF